MYYVSLLRGMAGPIAQGITVNGVLNLCGVSSPGRCAEVTASYISYDIKF